MAHQSVAIDGCREVLYKNRTENAIRVVVLFFFYQRVDLTIHIPVRSLTTFFPRGGPTPKPLSIDATRTSKSITCSVRVYKASIEIHAKL